MPFLIIAILIQLFLIYHVIKTGKNTGWIWAFWMLPILSGIAYLMIEVLPDMMKARRSNVQGRQYENVVNADFRRLNVKEKTKTNFETDLEEAEEYFNQGEFEKAQTLYRKHATGKHTYEPVLMVGAAKCCFELKDFEQAKSILDELIKHNPNYKNPDAHLLYAQTLAELDEVENANHEFETLHGYYTGPKASFYFAQFVKKQGDVEKANAIFNEILKESEESGGHYEVIYFNIIQQVKDELNEV